MFPTYYLLNLAFTAGYTLALFVYLGRYSSPDDPKTGAFQRWLIWAVAWAFFDALISEVASSHTPQTAFALYRWLSFLPLMVPGFVGELALALIRPVRWRDRIWLYGPCLGFYAVALVAPHLVSARLYGIRLGAPSHFNYWWQIFLLYSFSLILALLLRLAFNARAERDPDARREKNMLVIGGVLTLALQGLAQWHMAKAGPDFPALANLAVMPIALAIFWGTRRYGKVISPRAMYRAMVQAVPSGLAHAQGGRITWANRSLADLLAHPRAEDIMGRPLEGFFRPAQAGPQESREFLARLLRGRLRGEEVDLPDINGQPVRCLVSSSLFARGEPGRGVLVVANDLRRLRSVQEDLQHSEARYRNLVEQSSELIAVVQDEVFVYANRAIKDILGLEPAEAVGQGLEVFFHPEELQVILQHYRARISGQAAPQVFPCRMITKEGGVKWLEAASRVVDWEGRPALQVFFRDISERKRAEEENQARLERVKRQQAAIVRAATLEAAVTGDMDRAMAQLTELAAEALQVERCGVWLFAADRETLRCMDHFEASRGRHRAGFALRAKDYPAYFQAIEEGRVVDAPDAQNDPRTAEFSQEFLQPQNITSMLGAAIRLEGSLVGAVSLEHTGPPRRWNQDEVAFAGAMADQVAQAMSAAQRRQAEEALKDSEQRYRDLFESIGDFIYTHDLDGRLLSANPAVLKALGRPPEEVIGRLITEFMLPADAQVFREQYLPALSQEGKAAGLSRYLDREGGQNYLEYHNVLVRQPGQEPYVSGSGREVTQRVLAQRELKHLQEQLVQVQKMEALGVLASGIAHDFNNILQGVSGQVQLLAQGPNLDALGRRHLDQIDDAINRAAGLVRRLLNFGRQVDSRLRPLDLNELVMETMGILERTIPKMISISTRLEPGLRLINADPNLLEQVLMNLGANARDAMPQGGKLLFETANLVVDREYSRRHPVLEPGEYVLLTVSDDGMGMDQDTLRYVFEPFFTTKKGGEGSGLGLFTVYGIVESHKGYITCQSQPGRGASFSIHLPVLSEQAAAAPSPRGNRPPPPQGTETILLVDDEVPILESTRQLLAGYGYQVLTADSGEGALEIYQQRPEMVDLVILDLGMPGMGGERCLAELLKTNPQVKVIVATGYIHSGVRSQMLGSGARKFVSKPYRLRDLLATVREALDAP